MLGSKLSGGKSAARILMPGVRNTSLTADVAPTIVFALLFGLAFGSFLNVCIARIPEGLSIVSPRSRCPRCETPIKSYDNVPVFGWLWLRGKCRSCGLPISPMYPLVEFATHAGASLF